jgi:hypothetical protein
MGGLAGGLLSGLQGVQAFNQQRRENQQANRRLDIYDRQVGVMESDAELRRKEAARLDEVRSNDQYREALNTAGFLSVDQLSLNKDAFRTGIENNDPRVLDLVTRSKMLPPGSKATGFRRLESGAYTVDVENTDGTFGAVTVDGESGQDSVLKQFSLDELVNTANILYQTKVIPASSYDANQVRAQMDRIGIEYDGAQLQAQLDRVLRKADVVNAVPQGGAQRAAISAISSAATPEEEDEVVGMIAQDVGIAAPAPAQPAATSAAPPAATPAPVTAPKRPEAFEGLRKRREARLAELNAKVKEAEEAVAKGTRGVARASSSAAQTRLEKAIAERDAYQARMDKVGTTPARNQPSSFVAAAPPAAKQSLQTVEDAVVGKTDAEVDAAIEAGEVVVTPEAQAAVAQTLREQEIEKLEDLLRLNAKDRAIARAAILATESDPTIRNQMSQEMTNIFETGTASMSGVQAVEADLAQQRIDVNRGTLAQSIRKFTTDLATNDIQSAVETGREMSRATTGIFTNEDGSFNLSADTANQFFNQVLPEYMTMFDSLSSELSPRTQQAVFRGLSQGISLGVASLAAEEEGGFSETLKSFFRSDAVDTASAGSFNLERVIISRWGEDSEGNPIPEQFSYTDGQGNVVDEGVDATLIQNLNGTVYDILTAAAKTNKKSAKAE